MVGSQASPRLRVSVAVVAKSSRRPQPGASAPRRGRLRRAGVAGKSRPKGGAKSRPKSGAKSPPKSGAKSRAKSGDKSPPKSGDKSLPKSPPKSPPRDTRGAASASGGWSRMAEVRQQIADFRSQKYRFEEFRPWLRAGFSIRGWTFLRHFGGWPAYIHMRAKI